MLDANKHRLHQVQIWLTVFEPTNDIALMSSSSQILLTVSCKSEKQAINSTMELDAAETIDWR